eukprot:scaffold65350_cov27-Tisochrysis_lutea.AAC.1
MDKGRKGPWIFYVDEDAHDQFKTAYGDKVHAIFDGITHNFVVTYGSLVDSAPRKSSSVRSSLKEVATYIVFRIFDPVKAYKTKTRHLASALEREGFHVLRGNQQRAKTVLGGITKVESGKRPIWHFYDVYTDTTALGHRFPRNFYVTLDDGQSFNLDYAVRSSVECITPDGEIAIHGAPGGCKRYDQPWAISYLRKNQ